MQPEVWAEIKRLRTADKLPIAEIARRVRRDRKTVRRALAAQGLPEPKRRRLKPSKLEPYKPYLKERIEQYPNLSGAALLEEIKRQGYAGKIRIVTEYLATIRQKAKEVFLRLETPAGDQIQCDWANCGSVVVGNAVRKLSCFVMVLSFSRLMYAEFTLSQCLETFIECHLNAFKAFGGLTRRILYDNLKLVVLSRLGAEVRFNPKFMEFAGVMGFEPVLCNIAAGWEKGKVESGIGYLRKNFLEGKTPAWPQINKDVRWWLDNVANVRQHRTTREKPIERWEREKPHLLPLPARGYDACVLVPVSSTHQAEIRFDGNIYTVPPAWAHKTLLLRAGADEVVIFGDSREIARHRRSFDRGAVIEDPRHREDILAIKKRAWAAKMRTAFLETGQAAQAYLDGLVQSEAHPQRHVARIMELAATYGKDEVVEALRRALELKAFGAGYVQNILLQKRAAKGLKEILPLEIPQKPSWNELYTEEPDLSIYDRLDNEPEAGPKANAGSGRTKGGGHAA